MTHTLPNDLRTHRRTSGFSQRDLAHVVGYRHAGPVSRHETLRATPSLAVAFGYEAALRVPATRIFFGLRNQVESDVEERIAELEAALGEHSAKERNAKAIAQRLTWLAQRRNTESEPEPMP
jgi:DNA-binding XRE family transcriptional regulator